LRQRLHFEHGFPLIRSLRASAQRSTLVLFSFVLSLLIVAESLAVRQSETILARSWEREKGVFCQETVMKSFEKTQHYCFSQWQVLPFIFGHKPPLPGPEHPQSMHSLAAAARGRGKWAGEPAVSANARTVM
jgi:hypothetical protein